MIAYLVSKAQVEKAFKNQERIFERIEKELVKEQSTVLIGVVRNFLKHPLTATQKEELERIVEQAVKNRIDCIALSDELYDRLYQAGYERWSLEFSDILPLLKALYEDYLKHSRKKLVPFWEGSLHLIPLQIYSGKER